MLVLGTTSLEYPDFTSGDSEWNDLLEWKITPSSGNAIDGSLNVNDRHEDWEIDEVNGVTLHDFGPSPGVHIETVRVIQASAHADMTVKVQLTATNIGDGTLPSTLIVGLLPVKFITPAGDPVSAPVDAANVADSSVSVPDGANEFTFSSAASGVLTMKLKARISDIDSLPLAEQAKFKFELDGIGNSTFAWDSANPGGKVTVSGDFVTATATYTGLPLANSDFGLKMARLMYNSEKITEDDFEVFFPRDATNHPEGQANSANWFYYWKDGQVCGIPGDAIYDATDPTSFGYTQPDQDSILRLCPGAPTVGGAPLTLISTITKPGTSPPETYGTITVGASGAGILCVAQTVSHELYHITMYADLTGKADVDADGVADSSEGSLGGIQSSAAHPDTYGLSSLGGVYAVYATYGDEEVRGMKQESNVTFPVLPTKDWANPGCQSADQHGPQP